MKANIINFFTMYNGLYPIIIAIILVLFLFLCRLFAISNIKDKIVSQQASEMHDKVIILRDCYQVAIWKQMVSTSNIIIIGVHGLQGQKDDFKLLSNLCRKVGISLISYDRRGLGKNEQEWKFKSLGTDINDLKDVIAAIKTKYPDQQIIVCGESLGAAIASHATKNNSDVSGLIISNLVTKRNLHDFSLAFLFISSFAFLFNSNIKIPVFIDGSDISSSKAYITNYEQKYSNRQEWSLRFLRQFKKINKSSVAAISTNNIPTLILQSADDVFSDFHHLKVNRKYWKQHHHYCFLFSGKHALINEPNINEIFTTEINSWINNNINSSKKG